MDLLKEMFSAGVWGEKIPKVPKWIKWVHRNLSENHCPECLLLDNCWFFKSKSPKWPHHPYCHCILEPLSYDKVVKNAASKAEYSKFDPFLFDPENFYKHGKAKMLISWGYSIKDSNWLLKEFEKQGLEKYIAGNYQLGKLDSKAQRLNIRIELPRKDKEGTVSFDSAWQIYPDGFIRLVTPYGGE